MAAYWEQVILMNEYQKKRFSRKIVSRMFNTVTGKKLCMLGFAFKKDTGDTRETAAAYVGRDLLEERAELAVFDPKVTREQMFEEFAYTLNVTEETVPGLKTLVTNYEDAYSAAAGSHALVVMTEWDEFKSYDFERIYASMAKPAFVFDGRNILDHARLREIGFEVYAIGKPEPKGLF